MTSNNFWPLFSTLGPYRFHPYLTSCVDIIKAWPRGHFRSPDLCNTFFSAINVTFSWTTLFFHFSAPFECHGGRFKTCVGRSGGVAVAWRSSFRSPLPRRLARLSCSCFRFHLISELPDLLQDANVVEEAILWKVFRYLLIQTAAMAC